MAATDGSRGVWGGDPPSGYLLYEQVMAESNNVLTKLHDLLLYLVPQ